MSRHYSASVMGRFRQQVIAAKPSGRDGITVRSVAIITHQGMFGVNVAETTASNSDEV